MELPEKKRIVAKVDRLMALCDQLEAQLAQSQSDCDALLDRGRATLSTRY